MRRPLLLPTPLAVDDLVRVGRDNDGGYVVGRRSVLGSDLLIGLGINTDWSFEQQFAAMNPGAAVVAVDGSVSATRFEHDGVVERLHAGRLALSRRGGARGRWQAGSEYQALARDFRAFFHAPRRLHVERMISGDSYDGSLTWSELARIIDDRFPEARSWFVKMDIEGHEYRVVPQMLSDIARVTGLVVEFHDCDLLWERLEETLALLDPHFALVHAHGNNCGPLIAGSCMPRVLELSFLRRTLLEAHEGARTNDRRYPLAGLDMPNNPTLPDPPVPFTRDGSSHPAE